MTSPSTEHSAFLDTRVDPKVVLAGLWTAMLFVFAYVDIFAFWRADVIEGALAGEVPGPGFTIGQAFLTLTTLYIVVPSLMIPASLLTRATLNRRLQLVVAAVYALTIAGSMVGESWHYYLLGSVVELALLAAVARTALRWPTDDAWHPSGDARCDAPLGPASAHR